MWILFFFLVFLWAFLSVRLTKWILNEGMREHVCSSSNMWIDLPFKIKNYDRKNMLIQNKDNDIIFISIHMCLFNLYLLMDDNFWLYIKKTNFNEDYVRKD